VSVESEPSATARGVGSRVTAGADADTDADGARLARHASGLLRAFNQAGVLDAADVHVASRLGALGGVADEAVLLAAALAARAPRLGHVCVDLATIAGTAATEEGDAVVDLAWPEPSAWCDALRASPLVGPGRPLQLDGTVAYLDRLHAQECRVAAALLARSGQSAGPVEEAALDVGLDLLFPDDGAGNRQRLAAATAARQRLTVIAGGPGTGKTTTVARLLALLDDQARATGRQPPLVALAAPTGKAAARLQEAVRAEVERLDLDAGGASGRWTASTIHRLLGSRADSSTRFRHDETHPLVHDVVVVDEASMLSLSLMDRLLVALRPDARLVLLGDPHQLASVEAGVVLGDIVGGTLGDDIGNVGGTLGATSDEQPAGGSPMRPSVVVLRRNHRFAGAIADLATAVRDGDADRALELLGDEGSGGGGGGGELSWIPVPAVVGTEADGLLAALRDEAVDAWGQVTRAALAGEASAALDALGAFRVLCAHRRGPAGASNWTAQLERWLADSTTATVRPGGWYAGQPLLVTINDYDLRLFNGDTGVVVAAGTGRLLAAFERADGRAELGVNQLPHAETCYAMTIHKAQGSQFDTVAVVLPDASSRVLTRELLYTGITRARRRVIVVGERASIAAAIGRPVARASGLGRRLRGVPGEPVPRAASPAAPPESAPESDDREGVADFPSPRNRRD
jgi:exodeoxyribonuclease V alpha subunit